MKINTHPLHAGRKVWIKVKNEDDYFVGTIESADELGIAITNVVQTDGYSHRGGHMPTFFPWSSVRQVNLGTEP